jgi:hypothetical protein
LNPNSKQITWVTPDGAWSDHPGLGSGSPPLGPSWVGNIINAIGNSYTNSNQNCDYWGTNLPQGQAEPTAILVVWDDWAAFLITSSPTRSTGARARQCPDVDAPNGWGCGYVYGFRVPFLAVSEYTGTTSNGQYSGYIFGPCGATGQPACPNTTQIYQHDFGSILAFTEYNFGLPFIDGPPDDGYADYNAPDWGTTRQNIPLSTSSHCGRGRGPREAVCADFHRLWRKQLSELLYAELGVSRRPGRVLSNLVRQSTRCGPRHKSGSV